MGDHRLSSRRRATIIHHLADGQSAYPIASTGNNRSSTIIAPTGNHPSSSRRRAISISYRADGQSSITNHHCADGLSSIINNLRADGRSSLIIVLTGDHSQPSRRAI
jgi:hypothetical protein